MNDYLKFKSWLAHAGNPYRGAKNSWFASKHDYDHIIGKLPVEDPVKPKPQEPKAKDPEPKAKQPEAKPKASTPDPKGQDSKPKTKTVEDMQTKVQRLQLEKKYAELTKKETVGEVASNATKDMFVGVKSLSESTAKLFERKAGVSKKYLKYPNISDAELASRLNRIRMEQQYSDIMGDTKNIKNGAEKTRETLQTIGALAGIGVSIATIAATIYGFKNGTGGSKK